ncbi:olfactory receptor 10A2-like [Eleutherodactylus coqui]|uniref:olfactory receptor 10A2-like n=1 Tax=Eleutherodactylus coqui TaxID=57060 RepID=UPI003462FF0D
MWQRASEFWGIILLLRLMDFGAFNDCIHLQEPLLALETQYLTSTLRYCNKDFAETISENWLGQNIGFSHLSHEKENNLTAVIDFFLTGFQGDYYVRNLLFCFLFVVFITTIYGNLLIITLVSTSKNLHTPMYFFISQLSISDILLTTDIVPNMLHILLNNGGTITFIGCITQFYFFCVSEASECLLLTVMSYDRYVAICDPLHYASTITMFLCLKWVAVCWFLGFLIALIDTYRPSTLTFCGPNVIDHFFCDLIPLLEIACSDTFVVQLQNSLLGIPVLVIPIIIIITCYVHIISTILMIPSNISRHKAFSTCSSHLIVVSIFYCSLFSVYIIPRKGQSSSISKVLSLLYTVFTPFINPIIYSLRNKDIKKAGLSSEHRVNWPERDLKMENNLTTMTDFFLTGFQGSHYVRISLFCFLLVFFGATIFGNLLIITLVSINKNLHTPMYFFISQLSISDLLLTSDISPKTLHILLKDGGAISFIGCMTQLYFFLVSEASECLLLTASERLLTHQA